MTKDPSPNTLVSLVGAGPGDPSLLTVKAIKRLKEADAIFYDALVNPVILSYCRKGIERTAVGKRCGQHSHEQEEINRLLVERAQKGGKIVRLKGGDPFVFGRGGEEMLALKENNIPYEIIPGLTSALAVTAYSGIPITHRGMSRCATLVTASTKDHKIDNTSWKGLVDIGGTLIFYMGTNVIPKLCERLKQAGMPGNTPACVVSNGTLPQQSCIKADLDTFVPDYTNYKKLSPGLFIVGDVVSFAETYAFFRPDKFAQTKVLCVNVESNTSSLAAPIEREGGYIYTLATTSTQKSCLSETEIKALQTLQQNSYLLFTSPKAVDYLIENLLDNEEDIRALGKGKIISIGKTTSKRLLKYGLKADITTTKKSAEGFIEEVTTYLNKEKDSTLVLCHAKQDAYSKEIIKIKQKGFPLYDLELFESKLIDYCKDDVVYLKEINFTHVVFTSSRAVENFYLIMKKYELDEIITNAKNIAMGPITKSAMEELNVHVSASAKHSKTDEIIEIIKEDY